MNKRIIVQLTSSIKIKLKLKINQVKENYRLEIKMMKLMLEVKENFSERRINE